LLLTNEIVTVILSFMELFQLAERAPKWSLDDLVEVANRFMPDFLPPRQVRGRSQEEVNPRLVRHYTTIGLIDRPARVGKEARYGYRHLLQLLVLRRLLSDGYSAQTIAPVVEKDDHQLERLLQGGTRLTVEAANPALAYLQGIKQRSRPGGPESRHMLVHSEPAFIQPSLERWTRRQLLPGLELHIRDDFVWSDAPQERSILLEEVGQALKETAMRKRRSK
jgi:DNA-binding transcriptional MerR regulator